LNNYQKALEDFQQANRLNSEDKRVKKLLEEVSKALKKRR